MNRWEQTAERIALAHAILRAEKHLSAVALDDLERRQWQNHDLASYAEHRLGSEVDPLDLAETERSELIRKATDEGRLYDIDGGGYAIPYWVQAGGETVGTIALGLHSSSGSVSISSLFVRRPYRRCGHARRLLTLIRETARRADLDGIELGTSWCWQPAVRLYLNTAMWVRMWKRDLRLVQRKDLPNWSLCEQGDVVSFCVPLREQAPPSPLIHARRNGTRLEWTELDALKTLGGEVSWLAPGTFALALAARGWPLITSDHAWEEQCEQGFSDGGGPEGLAFNIVRWEAWARHRGWLVRTPRIPGLDYPGWRELYPDDD